MFLKSSSQELISCKILLARHLIARQTGTEWIAQLEAKLLMIIFIWKYFISITEQFSRRCVACTHRKYNIGYYIKIVRYINTIPIINIIIVIIIIIIIIIIITIAI